MRNRAVKTQWVKIVSEDQSYFLEMPLMCLFNIVPKYLNEVWSKRLEYELNYNINGTTTILCCARAGVLVFIKRIPIFAFHSLMQFSKVPYKMSSCLVDNCRWEICCLFILIYGLLRPRPGQWGCLTVNRSSGSQYIPANGGPPGCCHHQHECSHQKNFPCDVRSFGVAFWKKKATRTASTVKREQSWLTLA